MPILTTTLLAFVSLVNCQYFGDLTATPSAFQSFNVSLPNSPFLLNFADNDLTLMSKSSDVYNVRDGTAYIATIYQDYLSSGVYGSYLMHCHNAYGQYTKITPEQVYQAISNSINDLKAYIAADLEVARNVPQTRFSSRFMAQLVHENRFAELVTENLIRSNCISKLEAAVELPKLGLTKFAPSQAIAKYAPVSCQSSKNIKLNCNWNSRYAAYDASCNNIFNPSLGMSFTCHKRLLPADYSDGIAAFRKSVNGQDLPNSRLLTNFLLPDVDEVHPELTQMVMQWGQSMVHDQARTPQTLANAPLCCPPQSSTHPECSRIEPLPAGDILTKIFNQTCLRQVRTAPCNNCVLGPRDALNANTMVLDLSHIYGYTYNDALRLRTFVGGKMKLQQDAAGGDIMPTAQGPWFDPITLQPCNVPKSFPQFNCFANADGTRGTQHPAITAVTTLLLRRHNQHCDALAQVNPHWDDEQIYLEARKINVAESNHFTFAEYMPAIFSPDIMEYFRLAPLKHGYSKYDPKVDPSTTTEWSTAAGRFGHSQINNVFFVKNANGETFTYNMRDVFFEPSLIYLGQTEGIIKGLITEPTMHVDPFFVSDIKNFMYQSPNRTSGLDLLVLNTHRGRDHGIPAYIHYLDYCFSYKVRTWEDLLKYIPSRQVARMQQIYSDVRDVDLFVGGVSERRLAGNAMGPTFACLNGIQWFHSKFGDRYFYEHGGQSGSFNEAQLANIKATATMARLICKTANSIKSVQPNVFRLPNNYDNQELPCESYPELDYNLWRESYKK